MKRAKSIFLWCGELVEQWRGWLPYWGFCSKKVRTSIKKHHHLISPGSYAGAFVFIKYYFKLIDKNTNTYLLFD